MNKNTTNGTWYPLVGPSYPTFIPIAPGSRKTSTWREWGRSPKPGVISIGLPRASQSDAAGLGDMFLGDRPNPTSGSDRPAEVWTPPATADSAVAPINTQTVRVIEELKKRQGTK
jgi:hypothetical protein